MIRTYSLITFRSPCIGRSGGFSLVELMVALVVGLILLAGVVSIFISSRSSYSSNSAVAQVQENGRFALDFVRREVRVAGYMGCANAPNMANYLNGNATLPYNFNQGIYGDEYQGTAPGGSYTITSWQPAPGAASAWAPALDASLSGVIPGSDVLVVRNTLGGGISLTSPFQNSAGFFLTSVNGLQNGQIAMVSDCVKGAVFQITNISGSSLRVDHSGNATLAPGNATPVWTKPGFGPGAQLYIPDTTVYYIGQGADGGPALFKADIVGSTNNNLTPKELVSGVENMQVLYGVDTTGAQVPSEYDTADVVDAAGNWDNVVSVRIGLLVCGGPGAIAPVASQSFNVLGTTIVLKPSAVNSLTNLCRVFTTTVGLRNRLP